MLSISNWLQAVQPSGAWPRWKRALHNLFIFEYLVNSCGKFGSPYLGKATAATRAVLLIPNSAWGIFMCPKHACRCWCMHFRTGAAWTLRDSQRCKLTLGAESFATSGNQGIRQYCPWHFGLMLYRLSYPTPECACQAVHYWHCCPTGGFFRPWWPELSARWSLSLLGCWSSSVIL